MHDAHTTARNVTHTPERQHTRQKTPQQQSHTLYRYSPNHCSVVPKHKLRKHERESLLDRSQIFDDSRQLWLQGIFE